MSIERGDSVALLRELVRVDSRNPSLVPGGPGERAVAMALADILSSWGMQVEVRDAVAGRPNVIARVPGNGSNGRSLMFNGHLDVVGVDGMVHAPFDALERDGRIYGRGSSDMKGGVAAMCAAAALVVGDLKGDLIVASVVDEEWQSIGTSALLASGVRADAAIVTEPTRLAIMPAHKGFAWLEITVHGRAAHGSRWDIGVDAIRHAGLLLAELDRIDEEDLPRSFPSASRAAIDPRGVGRAGESEQARTPTDVSSVLKGARFRVSAPPMPFRRWRKPAPACGRAGPGFARTSSLAFSQPPSDVPPNAPVVRDLSATLDARGLSPRLQGMSAWTDAALLNEAGIPAVCFGPGDMGLAHAAEEYIEAREVRNATDALAAFARSWCC